MSFRVSARLDDIHLDEAFDTQQAALDRAKGWTKAGLPRVVITHGGQEFTVDEFARRVDARFGPPDKPTK